MTLQATGSVANRIRWIGHRYIDLLRHPTPCLAQPIRIKRHAIADNVPHRDLLVSPDHAFLLGDVLVPARLLLNGASIVREQHRAAAWYFHVELDRHAVLLAENLPAESYLDTGNRNTFANADAALTLYPDVANWDGQARRVAGSCAPFADDAGRVEPIWRRLATRATILGMQPPQPPDATGEPALRLVVGGRIIAPVIADGGHHVFVMPANGSEARLVSRAAIPSDLMPWVSDQRTLGVMLSRMTLRIGDAVVPIPLDHPLLTKGWWQPERYGANLRRWTDGNALLVLPTRGPAILEVEVAGTLAYQASPHAPSTLSSGVAHLASAEVPVRRRGTARAS
jgi:hypothetical protein